MAIQEFYDACVARFDADTGPGGDATLSLPRIARTLYIGFAGGRAKSVLPYVEMHMASDETLDTFTKDMEGGVYQFSCFSKSIDPDRAFDIRKQMIRVFDNALIAESTPGTTFTTVAFERIDGGFGPRLVEGVYQTVLRFRVLLSLTTNNPVTRYA